LAHVILVFHNQNGATLRWDRDLPVAEYHVPLAAAVVSAEGSNP
jgi:hypothetical protein